MQAIYYPLTELEVKTGESFSLVSNHDEYSLWFDLTREKEPGPTPMPRPSPGIHLAVSRQRLGQINDPARNSAVLSALAAIPKGANVLCISELSLLPVVAAAGGNSVFACESSRVMREVLVQCAEENGLKERMKFLEGPLEELSAKDLPSKVRGDSL